MISHFCKTMSTADEGGGILVALRDPTARCLGTVWRFLAVADEHRRLADEHRRLADPSVVARCPLPVQLQTSHSHHRGQRFGDLAASHSECECLVFSETFVVIISVSTISYLVWCYHTENHLGTLILFIASYLLIYEFLLRVSVLLVGLLLFL